MSIEEALSRLRVLLVAAHPDDETIGAGGILGRMRDPYVLHVTDGAPRNPEFARAAGFESRDDYARARRRELTCALDLAGIPASHAVAFSVTDQRASFDMAGLARRLRQVLRDLQPGVVLLHPYEGGHPDHDATAFAVHAACALLPVPPKIYEYTSYHAMGPGDASIEAGRFLVGQDSGEAVALAPADQKRKAAMLACYESQADMLRHFSVAEERFREAPAYDFTRPPHAGQLFYETFPSGMTSENWLNLAGQAIEQLAVPVLI